jgi:hypothetical protein
MTWQRFAIFIEICVIAEDFICFQAEAWLKEQAQAMGWSKATKLEGRSTTQGLVGVLVNNNIGTMVEGELKFFSSSLKTQISS